MTAVPTHDAIPLLGDAYLDGILQGSAWVDGGGSVTLTYSFYEDPSGGGAFWSPGEQKGFRAALEAWSSVADIHFVEIPRAGDDVMFSNADINFVSAGFSGTDGLLGIGYFPDPDYIDDLLADSSLTRGDYPQPEGDIYIFDLDIAFPPNIHAGSLALSAIIHELGHTLGLKHPHDDGGNGRPLIAPGYDDGFWTIMSYNDPQYVTFPGITFDDVKLEKGFQSTPMPLDIRAIQIIYGVNYNYHTGDDTYYLFNDGLVKTIWDAGGTDTLIARGLSQAVTINLDADYSPGEGGAGGMSLIDHGDNYSFTALAYYVEDGFGNIVNYIENVVGTSFDDTLLGNGADNSIDGGKGADAMAGGDGNDTYFVDDIGDVVTELGGEGTDDRIVSTLSFDLSTDGVEVEHLTLVGSGKINGTGNTADNQITGNKAANTLDGGDGNDTLDGGKGADTLIGGLGDDVYYIDSAKDVITENLGEGSDTVFTTLKFVLSDNVENATLLSTKKASLTGNALDNILTGTGAPNTLLGLDGSDTLIGGAGKDVLDGGTGADDMNGGLGDDIFYVDDSADVVREALGEGLFDTVYASASFSLAPVESEGVERLFLVGTGNINGTGNAQDNTITGTSGDNILDGGAGADQLIGGLGDDTYVVDNQGDYILDKGGIDTVVSSISYTFGKLGFLAPSIENWTLSGSADINAVGNALNNTLTGNTGNNTLDGSSGNDVILGDDGNDLIIGGLGDDILTGGTGIDTFLFTATPGAKGGIDTITDFTNGPGGDVLDVSDILHGYTGVVTDFVRVTQSGGDTIVEVDVNGAQGGVNFVQIATLTGVNLGTDEAALIASGNLVVS